jgi:hypothetical protein
MRGRGHDSCASGLSIHGERLDSADPEWNVPVGRQRCWSGLASQVGEGSPLRSMATVSVTSLAPKTPRRVVSRPTPRDRNKPPARAW